MLNLTEEIVKKSVIAKGYKWFDGINIVGIRTNDSTPDKWNDFICISGKLKGKDVFFGFEATTDPGLYWLKKPMNVKGTAILVPGQYVNCWALGKHTGYEALTQVRPVSVYRDNNADDKFDLNPGSIDKGVFAVNIHRAHLTVLQWVVDKYSAGCQVVRKAESFNTLLSICKESGNLQFSYTLLTENDLK